MNWNLDDPPLPVTFFSPLLNQGSLLALLVCVLNGSSLLDGEQEAGPIFIPSESFTVLPMVPHRVRPLTQTGQAKWG